MNCSGAFSCCFEGICFEGIHPQQHAGPATCWRPFFAYLFFAYLVFAYVPDSPS